MIFTKLSVYFGLCYMRDVSSAVVLMLVANPNVHIDHYESSLYRTCVYYTESEIVYKDINYTNTTNTSTISDSVYTEDGGTQVYCELNLGRIILTIIICIYLCAGYIIINGLPRCLKSTKESYKKQLDVL